MTQLCTIPGCRIRGRHLGDCDDETCRGCQPRIADEGYTCGLCVDRADGWLAEIARLTPDARAVAAGLVRRGGGGGAGKPGSRPPLNDGATDALDEIQNAITTLARDIAETRGLQSPAAASTHADPLATACSWLRRSLGWVRHAVDDQGGPYAVAVFAEIRENAAKIRGIVNGPAEQRYLGPCGAPIAVDGCQASDGPACQLRPPGQCEIGTCAAIEPCDGDVYGRRGAQTGTCRTCGAQVEQADRRAWLDGEVRGWAFRASEIAAAYGLKANTIRVWAARGHIEPFGHDREGRPLFRVGEVLDRAAADAARRETERAKRERRAAERAAESEDAA